MKYKYIFTLIFIVSLYLLKQYFFSQKGEENQSVPPEDAKIYTEQPYTEYYHNGSKALVKHFNTVYYYKQGKEIGQFDSKTNTGTKITFYKDSLSDNCIAIKFKEQYRDGVIKNKKLYDINEELISEGSYKEGKPFKGTFYKKKCNINIIEEYKEGQKQKEIALDKNNKLLAKIHYKEGNPFLGTKYNCYDIRNYKNGLLHGKSTSYLDEFYLQSKKIESYAKGKLSGEYLVYDSNNELLMKLNFKDDNQLQGSQFFYNNEKRFYYEIKISDNQLITVIRKFSKDTNHLLKEYKVKPTTEDEFSFLEQPSSIEIVEEDINQDGYIDIAIKNFFYRRQHFSSYYLYDTLTAQLVYVSELADTQSYKITNKNEIVVYQSDSFQGDVITSNEITYNISDIHNVEKVKEIENVYFVEEDKHVTTQLYPIDYKKYPLLDESLPPILLAQDDLQIKLNKEYQEITLKKGLPFTFSFTGDISKKHYPSDFYIKVCVTLNKKNLEQVYEGAFEKDISFFSPGSSMAVSKTAFTIMDDANNIWVYDKDSKYNNIEIQHQIKDNVYTFSYLVDTIPNYNKNGKKIDFLRNNTSNKPLYAIIFIDKNRNKQLETNEFFMIKFNFN